MNLKNNKAVTLLALVITIVVLVILGGTTLALTLGEDGVLQSAIRAADETNRARFQEDTEIMIANYIAERESIGVELIDYLNKNNIEYDLDENGNVVIGNGDFEILVNPLTGAVDRAEKEVDMSRINVEPKVVEPGEELTAYVKLGNNVDVDNCKYLFRKQSEEEVTEEDINTPLVPQVGSIDDILLANEDVVFVAAKSTHQVIEVDLPTEDRLGVYEFYLLVHYKSSKKADVIKHADVVIGTAVNKINLSEDSLRLEKGKVEALTAEVVPSNATIGDIVWSSSNTDIVTVDQDGNVTAVAPGNAKIIVTALDGSGTKAECNVEVFEILIEDITLNKSAFNLTKGQEDTSLIATTTPANPTNPALKWESSDETVATVDQTGKITALKPGETTITASSQDGTNKSAQCTITVPVTYVTQITVGASSSSITRGSTITMTKSFQQTGPEPDNKEVTWTSTQTSVATIDSTGKVTAVAAGTTKIYCTSNDDNHVKSNEYSLTVNPILVTGITISASKTTLKVGDTVTMSKTFTPSNPDNTGVTWTSTSTSVATVDTSGKVTAKADGTTKIYCTSKDANAKKSNEVTITVNTKVQLASNGTYTYIYLNASSGNDSTGNGTSSKPYKTISKVMSSGLIVKDKSYRLILRSGTYDVPTNLFTSSTCNKTIELIGNRKNTILNVTSLFANGNGGSVNYSVKFGRLVWKGTSAATNAIFIRNRLEFYNVYFNMSFSNASVSYFIPGSNQGYYFYNCVLPKNIGAFLRAHGGNTQLTNCYGGFTFTRYGNDTGSQTWNYQTNIITSSPSVNSSTYQITDTKYTWKNAGTGTNPDGTRANIGLYGGTLSWEYNDDLF